MSTNQSICVTNDSFDRTSSLNDTISSKASLQIDKIISKFDEFNNNDVNKTKNILEKDPSSQEFTFKSIDHDDFTKDNFKKSLESTSDTNNKLSKYVYNENEDTRQNIYDILLKIENIDFDDINKIQDKIDYIRSKNNDISINIDVENKSINELKLLYNSKFKFLKDKTFKREKLFEIQSKLVKTLQHKLDNFTTKFKLSNALNKKREQNFTDKIYKLENRNDYFKKQLEKNHNNIQTELEKNQSEQINPVESIKIQTCEDKYNFTFKENKNNLKEQAEKINNSQTEINSLQDDIIDQTEFIFKLIKNKCHQEDAIKKLEDLKCLLNEKLNLVNELEKVVLDTNDTETLNKIKIFKQNISNNSYIVSELEKLINQKLKRIK